jgi:hypothetical protein
VDSDDLDRVVQDLMAEREAADAVVTRFAGGALVLLDGEALFRVFAGGDVQRVSERVMCDCWPGRTFGGEYFEPERNPECMVHGEQGVFTVRELALAEEVA